MQVVYRQIKQIKSENRSINFDRCHKNSRKLTQTLIHVENQDLGHI